MLQRELKNLAYRYPHLRDHLISFKRITGKYPEYKEVLTDDDKKLRRPNIIYPIGDILFAHVWGDGFNETRYYIIEPRLNEDEKEKYKVILEIVLERAVYVSPSSDEEFTDVLEEILYESVKIVRKKVVEKKEPKKIPIFGKFFRKSKVEVTEETYEKIRYRLNRDIVGLGPLEPLLRDRYFEDIHVINREITYGVHKIFGMVRTNVKWDGEEEYEKYLKALGERLGKPISDARPIIDAKLPDGSRLNLIYSDDVSFRGASLTIRKFKDVPISVTQLVKWGTLTPTLAAYLWLALENDMSIIIAGETASGKTTTLNAILTFIHHDAKIYTVEDTPEVIPPHSPWQQMVTREGEGRGSVTMFDLLKAALRSRPNYIIVGEVRGEEGRIAFQAMQTGHPVLFTFHAATIESLVQRLTSDPINIPMAFMGNVNIGVFQNYIKGRGVRRVTSVHEIEGYSKKFDGVVTREVFEYNYTTDQIIFKGFANSYILEEKVAEKMGFADRREIYDALGERARIIERMVQERILDYHEVNEIIKAYRLSGLEGLPFSIY
jgi:flagellar protein FlaI